MNELHLLAVMLHHKINRRFDQVHITQNVMLSIAVVHQLEKPFSQKHTFHSNMINA